MRILLLLMLFTLVTLPADSGEYERNKAVPVEKVMFGQIDSIRHITEHELIKDKENGWQVFGGALIGGVIGNQFGDGSGQVAATILGSMIGASAAKKEQNQQTVITYQLIELLITTEDGQQFMIVQDLDKNMLFSKQDKVRIIYLTNGLVRVDKQL